MKRLLSIREYIRESKDGSKRWISFVAEDVRYPRARLIMTNFLHTSKIPHCFDIHHKNENSLDDRMDNLLLMSAKEHRKLHHPREYKYGASRIENETEYHKGLRKANPDYKKRQQECCKTYHFKNREKRLAYMKEYGRTHRNNILNKKRREP